MLHRYVVLHGHRIVLSGSTSMRYVQIHPFKGLERLVLHWLPCFFSFTGAFLTLHVRLASANAHFLFYRMKRARARSTEYFYGLTLARYARPTVHFHFFLCMFFPVCPSHLLHLYGSCLVILSPYY